ncbi:MAG: hypothetical protein J2P48_06820 [Alphaproteobacteria bacterium]|nr:hypothetical protein [Alphaproteobacteria bacterium]
MIEYVERKLGQDVGERQTGSWRVVVSAWVLVLLFILLTTAAEAVACLRGGAHHDHGQTFARTVIPRHDACGGPGVPSAPGLDGCQNVPLGQDPSIAYW